MKLAHEKLIEGKSTEANVRVANRKAIGFADREQLMLHLKRKTVLFIDDANY